LARRAAFESGVAALRHEREKTIPQWAAQRLTRLERGAASALQLDFDVVIPGHSGVTDRAHLEGYLKETGRLQDMVRMMNRAKRSRDDIQAMLKTEFGWSDFMMNFGLDGIITEMQ
jgi:hypothetical protein